MLIFLIFAIIAFISVAVAIFARVIGKLHDKGIKNKFIEHFYYNDSNYYMVFGIVACAALLGAFICSAVTVVTACTRTVDYQKYKQTYLVISAKLEEDDKNYYLLAGEIINYNNAVIEDRYYADNIWLNWYHNGLIGTLPLIEK